MSGKELNAARNPFRCSVDSIPDKQQDRLINLKNDSVVKDLLEDKTVEDFQIHKISSYSNVARVALRPLLSLSTCLCECDITTMLIKFILRNRFELFDDIRCVLPQTSFSMDKVLKNKQCQRLN